MKKLGVTFLIAAMGGAIALGGYKLFENKQQESMTFEEKQKVFYANNPDADLISSSAGNLDFTQASAAVAPGVVHIKVTAKARNQQRGGGDPFDMFEEFFGVPQQRRQQQQQQQRPVTGSGSGVVISTDGYIVTNNHVVEDADKIEVVLTDNRKFEAKVIGRDPNTDLALIKVTANNLPIVKLGDSDKVQVGEWVLAVGYPMGFKSTVTAGIVSAKGRRIGILDDSQQQRQRGYGYQNPEEQMISTAVESFIQTDAVINRGNSGGALVNAQGELIGINSAIASPTGVYAGYGFAIPINLAKKILDDFKEFGSVKRGFIGVSFAEINDDTRDGLKTEEINGLYVQSVVKDGGAEAAGIKQGDILTKIEGRPIYSSSDLQEYVLRLRPDDKVKITYKRDGKEKTVSVTLKGEEVQKKAEEVAGNASGAEIFNKLGASFIPASDARKKELGVNSGVVVSQVHSGGLLDYFGFEQGLVVTEINGKPVNNVDEVESALANTKRNIVNIVSVPRRGMIRENNVPLEY